MALMVMPAFLEADQAQYFYDELGRLIGVVDGQGNVAVYTYDEVGNLLAIERFTTEASGIGIFLLTPSSCVVGTEVNIRGFGFSATPADNQVAFNGTAAAVVSASTETIVATVPVDATTGPVTVTNVTGTATSPKVFTVLVPPIVVEIDPAVIPQGTTYQATITGFGLETVTAVTFAQTGVSASILPGGTAQNLAVTLTAGTSVPPGAYAFSLESPLGTADSGTVTVTVTEAAPTSAMGQASIFKPYPPAAPPAGPTSQNTTTSVFKPYPAEAPPSGPTSSTIAVSVEMP